MTDKATIRDRVWNALEERGDARFPFPPHGRISNFAGAPEAAERLTELGVWQRADVIKSNPDAPQLPVRRAALAGRETLYMAIPRLAEEDCFLRLDPDEIDDIDSATTVSGCARFGTQVGPDAMEPVDLIVSGSVAVNDRGARIGKGEGYSDLEFAILRTFDLVDDDTTTVTTVHPIQVVDDEIPVDSHDVPMDRIVTPERTIRTDGASEKPKGIEWDALDPDRIDEIPILSQLHRSGE